MFSLKSVMPMLVLIAVLCGTCADAFSFHATTKRLLNTQVDLPTLLRSSHGEGYITGQRRRSGASNAIRGSKLDEYDVEVMGKGLATVLVTLGAAAQIAFASVDPGATPATTGMSGLGGNEAQSHVIGSSNVVVSIGAPKIGGGASFETLDFSLPSYNEAAGGDSSSATKSAPAFSNPFPDLKLPGSSEETKSAPKEEDTGVAEEAPKKADADAATKAEEKAKRVAAEKEKQEAAVKAREEEKARRIADEKAKEDAKVEAAKEKAAKEEEKVRRLAEEKKKQEAFKAKAKADAEEQASGEVKKPEADTSDAGTSGLPKLDLPSISVPKFEAPKFDTPKFDTPKFDIPKFEAPTFEAPKFDAPKVDVPSVSVPKFEAPKFDVPKFDAPSLPPKPSFSPLPSKGGDVVVEVQVEEIESQEIRDERARVARSEFNSLDKEAKEKEKAAKVARSNAKAAKKVAALAKGEACKTRVGGKFLCIRPFGIGY